MKTTPQEAARNAPDGEALFRALEMTPDQATAAEQGEQAGKRRGRRGRVRLGRHQPRHASPAQGESPFPDEGESVTDALAKLPPEAPAGESVPEPPRRPTFTPAVTQTGPMAAPQGRHASETERILSIAQRRADAAPVPEHEHPVTAAQAAAHAARLDEDHLKYPAYDSTDGYGNIPRYVALMRRVSLLTGTSSRFEFPGAWPLPVAPQALAHGLAVTAGTPLGEPMPGCWSLNAETGEKCGNAMPPPHGDHPHIGPSGDEWTDESGTYCGGDVDCTCWDHRQATAEQDGASREFPGMEVVDQLLEVIARLPEKDAAS